MRARGLRPPWAGTVGTIVHRSLVDEEDPNDFGAQNANIFHRFTLTRQWGEVASGDWMITVSDEAAGEAGYNEHRIWYHKPSESGTLESSWTTADLHQPPTLPGDCCGLPSRPTRSPDGANPAGN